MKLSFSFSKILYLDIHVLLLNEWVDFSYFLFKLNIFYLYFNLKNPVDFEFPKFFQGFLKPPHRLPIPTLYHSLQTNFRHPRKYFYRRFRPFLQQKYVPFFLTIFTTIIIATSLTSGVGQFYSAEPARLIRRWDYLAQGPGIIQRNFIFFSQK